MKKLTDEWKIKKNVIKNKSFRESIDFDLTIDDKNKSIKKIIQQGSKKCISPTSKLGTSSEMGMKRNLSPIVRKSCRLKTEQAACSSDQNVAHIQDDAKKSTTEKSPVQACQEHAISPQSSFGDANTAGSSKSKTIANCIESVSHFKVENLARNVKSCSTNDRIDKGACSHVTSDQNHESYSQERSDKSSYNEKQFVSSSFREARSCLVDKEDCYDLSFWGLPDQVIMAYKARNINKMFHWQYECLSMKDVLDGKNLVYSAPTSAGKTLVAEVLMLKKVLESKKKAMMILPFVSVVREKVNYFKEMFQDSGIVVDGFMGTHRPPGGFAAVDIAICTIEKANNLINRLMEEKKLDDLGILAVDELHMLGDSSRGYLLELLLTKLLYNCKKNDTNVQIIGMSATLPNLNVLSSWLQAELYHTDFRPVPLHEMYKVGPVIYDSKSSDPVRSLSKVGISFTNDADHTIFLTMETITAGNGVLIFCPSKNWCETLATSIAHEIYKVGRPAQTDNKNPTYLLVGEKLREHINGSSLNEVYIQLKNSPAGLDSVLKVTVPFGVAFHHAGLTFDERDIVEGAFRNGIIKVLVATSTLSSGVNLPARRVLIRSPMFCGSVIDTLSYKQMVGRAGRKGIDDQGESILICKESERKSALQLVNSSLPPVQSCLMKSGKSGLHASLKRAVIEVIASGAATTHEEVVQYGSCTLLFASLVHDDSSSEESDGNVESSIVKCLNYLLENDFIFKIEKKENDSVQISYKPSQLGNAVLASGFSPEDALRVLKELQIARRCFVLENDLHLLYEVTPPYLSDQMGSLNWMTFLSLWEQLPEDFRRVGELVGVRESFIALGVQGRVNVKSAQSYQKFSIHQRFYASLALNELIQEVPLSVVSQKYNCNKGILQSLQQTTSTFAGMLTIFCNKLGWHNMELLFSNFQKRVHFGIQQELCDLVQLSSLNAQRARLLYNAGFETVSSLAAANPEELELVLCNAGSFESEKQLEGDIAAEALLRREVKRVQITGKQGVNEKDAALLIIKEARHFIKYELGIDSVSWKNPAKDSTEVGHSSQDQPKPEVDKLVENVSIAAEAENQSQSSLALIDCEKSTVNNHKKVNAHAKCLKNGNSASVAAKESFTPIEQFTGKSAVKLQKTVNDGGDLEPKLVPQKRVSDLQKHSRQERSDCNEASENPTITCKGQNSEIPNAEVSFKPTRCKNLNQNQNMNLPRSGQGLGSVIPKDASNCAKESHLLEGTVKAVLDVPRNEDLDTSWQLKMSESGSEIDVDEEGTENNCLNIDPNPSADVAPKHVSCDRSITGFELEDVDNLFKELEETIRELNESRTEEGLLQQNPSDHDITLNQLLLSQCAETGDVYYSESLLKNGHQHFSFSEILGNISAENNVLSGLKVEEIEKKYINQDLTDKLNAIFDLSSFIEEQNSRRYKNSIASKLPKDLAISKPLPVFENENILNAELRIGENCTSTNCSFDTCPLTKNMTYQSTPKMPLPEKDDFKNIDYNAFNSPDLMANNESAFSEHNMEPVLNTSFMKQKFDVPVDEQVVIETSGDIFESEGSNGDHPDLIEVDQENIDACPDFENALFGTCSDDIFSSQTSFENLVDEKHNDLFKENSSMNDHCPVDTENFCGKSDKCSKREVDSAEEVFYDNKEAHLEDSVDIFEDSVESKSVNALNGKQTSFQYEEHSDFFKSWNESRSTVLPLDIKKVHHYPKPINICHQDDILETPFEVLQGLENDSSLDFSSDCLEPSPKKALFSVSKQASAIKLTSTVQSNELNQKSKRRLFQTTGSSKAAFENRNCIVSDIHLSQNSFSIVDVVDVEGFIQSLDKIPMFSFAVACEKVDDKKTVTIGPPKLRERKNSTAKKMCIDDDIFISGLCFCWCEKVHFIDLSDILPNGDPRSYSIDKVLKCLQDLFYSLVNKNIVMYDIKSYCKVLWRGCSIQLAQNEKISYFDPSIAAWLLNPAKGQQSLQELVTTYWTDAVPIVEGFDFCQGSLGLQHWSSVCGRRRAATEAYLSFNLLNVLLTYLNDKKLFKSFVDIEMPSVLVLSKMEQSGLGFDLKLAMSFRKELQKKQDSLMKKAHQLAGRKFNILSSRDLSRILYKELKLNPPDVNYSPMASKHLALGVVTRSGGRRLPPELKTNKECLERIMHLHPLPKTVVGWRQLSFAITKVLMPLLRENKYDTEQKMQRLYSTCFIYTVTGRVNMHTPNLQFIPRDFTVEANSPSPNNEDEDYFPIGDDMSEYGVSLRNMFIASEGHVLLTADYSQLELRILAHLSGDAKLRRSLNSGDDIFKQIAATWRNIPVDSVDNEVRQQAKRICYGIIYGISAKTLSHQLKTTERDAANFMETFKTSYPGVTSYLNSVIENCRAKGYVTTIMGRRRYLPSIVSESRSEKAHAERQAVNTTIQGSAADIIKKSMIEIDSQLDAFVQSSSQSCKGTRSSKKPDHKPGFLVLQLHDELIYEVSQKELETVISIVKTVMENSTKLSVVLPVNMHVGPSWGSMEDI